MFPQIVGNDLDLIVKYQSADISNTNLAYQSNVNVIKAVAAKYPEVRDAFAAIVARAVDPTGRDYGTLLAMKDIK
jgi:predicted solute-binding protein